MGCRPGALHLAVRAPWREGSHPFLRLGGGARLGNEDGGAEQDRSVDLTPLVRSNLATFIRSGKWWTDERDLERLMLSLEQGTYEDFVDPEVNVTWAKLVAKTIELARKRQAGTIAPEEVREYNETHRTWE